MQFPVIEIVDRYTIAVVKFNNTNGLNSEELDFYRSQMVEINIPIDHELILKLIEHHNYVWSMEDDFKKMRIDGLPLDEIGRRALLIRDVNINRVTLKNQLAELVNHSVKEYKNY
jgi:hypothetical protein